MPLFEYVCGQCGHHFEILILGSKQPACPSCGSKELEQEVSSFAMGHGESRGSGASGRSSSSVCGPTGGGGG